MKEIAENAAVNELVSFANFLGLTVDFKPLKYNDGRLRDKRILIREGMSTTKTIYALAHEIAHAALHFDKGDTMNSPKHDEYEEQAHRAAMLIIRAMSYAIVQQ